MDGHQGPREIGVGPEFFNWLTDPVKNGAGALFAFLRMRKRTLGEGMPFADTVAEFQRDREWLSSKR